MASYEIVRPACVTDAARIVELVRDGFAPDLADSFIYGCRGIESYVSQQIAAADLGIDTRYLVAEHRARAVACIEMRVFSDSLFLSYIAVDAAARNRGCGKRLLARAIDLLGRREHTQLALDVFEENRVARSWYEAIGMHVERVTSWHALPLPTPGAGGASGIVTGLVQAQLSHREFGFGQFSVTSHGRTHAVGMLGEHLFRITSREALDDPSVLACLATLDPDRRILALVPDGESVPNSTPFARTLRMTAPLADARARLREPT